MLPLFKSGLMFYIFRDYNHTVSAIVTYGLLELPVDLSKLNFKMEIYFIYRDSNCWFNPWVRREIMHIRNGKPS